MSFDNTGKFHSKLASNIVGNITSNDILNQSSQSNMSMHNYPPKGPFFRQVTIEAALKFSREEDLLFLGETSCSSGINCQELFELLIDKVHQTQTDLVRQGIKNIEDLRFGEEERNITYNRCCY